MNITKHGKLTRVSNAVAAGTGTVNGTGVDTKGFGSTTFIAAFGTLTSGTVVTLKAQQSPTTTTGDYGDIAGSSQTVAADDDNQICAVEIVGATERYLRPVITRTTANAVVDGIIAIQTDPHTEPVTHDSSTVVGTELHQAKATGTA